MGHCLQDLFQIARSVLVYFSSSFYSMRFVKVHVVHPYSSTDSAKAWKKSHFILSDRLDFHMIDKLLIAVLAFAKGMLTSLSVDEILLPRYMNLTTIFRGFPLRVKIAPSRLKHM